MNAEEIRQKAIECGENFRTMCISNTTLDRKFNAVCAYNCEYTGVEHCSTVYGYEHGVEEGKRMATTWIPVMERLPEKRGKNYLVCLKNGRIDIAISMYDRRLVFIREHHICEPSDTNPIIAWMPLPEPYKKGEEA